jgi:hypothetical protein
MCCRRLEEFRNCTLLATVMVSEWEESKQSRSQDAMGELGTIYIQDQLPGVCPSLKISSQRHAQSQQSARLGGTTSTAMTSWKRVGKR